MGLSIILGIILGLIVAFIAYSQSIDIWKQQGFARAKTPEEKEKVKSYWKNNQSKVEKHWVLWGLSLAVAVPIIAKLLNIQLQIIFVLIPFLIFFLGGFILSAFISDNSIRRKS